MLPRWPWAAWSASTLHLDSHDTPRFRTVVGGGASGWVDHEGRGRARHLVGLALQMTMPGVPAVFAGDELGLTGVDGEHSRTPFPWSRTAEWDEPTVDAYRRWIARRRRLVRLYAVKSNPRVCRRCSSSCSKVSASDRSAIAR